MRLLLPLDYFKLPLPSDDTVVIYPWAGITTAKALWADRCPPEGEGSTEYNARLGIRNKLLAITMLSCVCGYTENRIIHWFLNHLDHLPILHGSRHRCVHLQTNIQRSRPGIINHLRLTTSSWMLTVVYGQQHLEILNEFIDSPVRLITPRDLASPPVWFSQPPLS